MKYRNARTATAALLLTLSSALVALSGCSHKDSGSENTGSNTQAVDTDQDGIPDCIDPVLPHFDSAGAVVAGCVPVDNCALRANHDQKNVDADLSGDVCDSDLDGDGVANCADNGVVPCDSTAAGTGRSTPSAKLDDCMYIANAKPACTTNANCVGAGGTCVLAGDAGTGTCSGQLDTDGDGNGDACDGDKDNDTVLDGADNCPSAPNANQKDSDQDGTGDACDYDSDNDGICDPGSPQVGCTGSDNCGTVANANQSNFDVDTMGDACDPDDDNDGVQDSQDNCDFTANPSQVDNDKDGIGDACENDWDNDGVLNGNDNCPYVPNVTQADLDHDGVGDVCEGDTDGDGVSDCTNVKLTYTSAGCVVKDNCALVANFDQLDQDSDGLGNVCDPDLDGDGVLNAADNCPSIANANQANMDGDSMGDVCDDDTDGDGVLNGLDNCPLVVNANQANADGDAFGDACDADSDNDGICNVGVVSTQCTGTDNCPAVWNPSQSNLDGDALGDACDPDADNDGVTQAAGDCCDTGTEASGLRTCNSLTAVGIKPGAAELCDRQDNDCDGIRDDGTDDDLDGWSEVGVAAALACPVALGGAGDCDDTNANIHPTAPDTCGDGIDQDCAGGDAVCSDGGAGTGGSGGTDGGTDAGSDGAAGTGGAGGASGSGGTGGTAGTGGAGGSAGTGGTGGSGGGVGNSTKTFTFTFTAPAGYPGGAISLMGYVLNGQPWGTMCADTNASATVFACDITLPVGSVMEFQVYMPEAGAPGGFRYWGDENYKTPTAGCSTCSCSAWGGDGAVQGTVALSSGAISMVPNPTFNDANVALRCEVGEMLTYNGRTTF